MPHDVNERGAGKHDPDENPCEGLVFRGDPRDEPSVSIDDGGKEHQIGISEAGDEGIGEFGVSGDEEVFEPNARDFGEDMCADALGNGVRCTQGLNMCLINKMFPQPTVKTCELHHKKT